MQIWYIYQMKSQMYQKIEESTCHVASRKMVSNFAMKEENRLKEMIQLAFDTKHELHVKAFWSLDLVCEKKLKQFIPFIEDFCEVLPKIKEDSALRPATKIAFFLSKSNHRKQGQLSNPDKDTVWYSGQGSHVC